MKFTKLAICIVLLNVIFSTTLGLKNDDDDFAEFAEFDEEGRRAYEYDEPPGGLLQINHYVFL